MREKRIRQKETRRNFAEQFRWILLLFSVTFGMCTSLSSILEMDIEHLEWFAAGICVLFYFGRKGRIWTVGISLVSFGAIAVMLVKYWEVWVNGVKCLENTVLRLINEYYGMNLLYWYLEEKNQGLSIVFFMLLLFISVLEGLILSATAKKSTGILAALLPVVVQLCGLLVGCPPGIKGMFWLILGLFLHLVYLGMAENWKLIAVTAGIMGITALAFGGSIGTRFWEKYHEPWKSAQLKLEERALEFTQEHLNIDELLAEIPKTRMNLSNRAPNETGADIFKITLSQRPKHPLYLKGFVGETYQNGRWDAGEQQEFSDLAQKNGYSAEEYAETIQRIPYLCTMLSNIKPADIRLEMLDTVAGYTLIPYCTIMSEDMDLNTDGALEPSKKKNYQLSGYLEHSDSWNNSFYMEASSKIDAARQGLPKGADAWQQQLDEAHWEQYISYVKKHDLDYPAKKLPRLIQEAERIKTYIADFFAGQGVDFNGLSLENRRYLYQKLVQERMAVDTRYSLELSDVPSDKDFAEYFLLDQKKGFCVHYATAGTLLLRILGIPSRYVSGYVALPGDFKRNADGSYTAVVTDKRAHAWTEVFQEDFGFYPVEMTPASYMEAVESAMEEERDMQSIVSDMYRQKAGVEESAKRVEQRKTKAAAEEQPRTETPDKDTDSSGQDGSAGTGISQSEKREPSDIGTWAVGIIAGILLCGALISLPVIRRKRYWKKKHSAFGQQDRSRAVLAIGGEAFRILQNQNMTVPPGMQEREYGAWLGKQIPLDHTIGWENFISILQEARFSNKPVEESQYLEVYHMYRRLKKEFLAGKNRIQVFYYRYVKILS